MSARSVSRDVRGIFAVSCRVAARVSVAVLACAACSKTAPAAPAAPTGPTAPTERTAAGPRPNVVVIVLDTARPEYLSAYGHPRPTSPFLEEFARAGTRFDRAYSVSCWTLPAHASLFSGLMPDVHGADQKSKKICDAAPLLAERLSHAGYQTAGFSNNPWVANLTGLARGFQHFQENLNKPEVPGAWLDNTWPEHPTIKAVDAWFERERERDQPFFLFVNLIEPHMPYKPSFEAAAPFFSSRQELQDAVRHFFPTGKPSPFQDRHYGRKNPLTDAEWELLHRLYEGELRLVDGIARGILATVDRESDPAQTLVFIVSDHGENLGDHGLIDHMFNLYESNLRIVCLARGRGFGAGEVRNDLVQLVDLYPTILRAAGLEPEPNCAGIDLRGTPPVQRTLRAMLDFPQATLDAFPAELVASGVLDAYKTELLGAITSDFKTIQRSGGKRESFDLLHDSAEKQPLAGALDQPALSEALERLLGPRLCTHGPGAEFDAQTRREMKALGYAGDDDEEPAKPDGGE